MENYGSYSGEGGAHDYGIQTGVFSAGTLTVSANLASTVDCAALTGTVTVAAPAGTPKDGQVLVLRMVTTGIVTWNFNAIYQFGTDIVVGDVPTASGASFELTVRYKAGAAKWRVIALSRGY